MAMAETSKEDGTLQHGAGGGCNLEGVTGGGTLDGGLSEIERVGMKRRLGRKKDVGPIARSYVS